MRKHTRDKVTKVLVIFVVFMFIIGLLPMFFR
ncbi:DUF4044 domain-containing protein [Clostridium sp. Mt-5]|uniref:DUF4044 domain-containing protein n=1 Tax=Clostridium moutaii TaxID=3240932 RepID=A0ABV4BLB7_9CLOT